MDIKSVSIGHRSRGKLVRGSISVAAIGGVVAYVVGRSDPHHVLTILGRISPEQVGGVLLALLCGALLAALRLKFIAADIGQPLRFRDAVAALSVGQIVGSLFFQVVGQLIARSALLARRGVPVSATVVITGYERAVALFVSLTLALAGAWFLFGKVSLDLRHGGIDLLTLAGGAIIATVAGGTIGWGPVARSKMPGKRLTASMLARAARSVALSVGVQFSTLTAYLVLARALAPGTPLSEITAAVVVVMLAASLPISLSGWGVREVSAVLALGLVGLEPDKALVVGIGIGVGALIIVAVLAVLSTWGQGKPDVESPAQQPVSIGRPEYGAALAWFLPLAAATAVFFQIHVPTTHGDIVNVNLADPLAMLGGALFLVWSLRDRRWPEWRLGRLNGHMVAATAVMLLGFLHGWMVFGWTAWAATNKLFGWFVLLGYAATGSLIVRQAGEDGYGIFLRTFAGAGLAVMVAAILLMTVRILDLPLATDLAGNRATGFAANANAFAFQILMMTAVVAALAPRARDPWTSVLFAIPMVAVFYTGSRAGFGTETILLAVIFILYTRLRRALALALVTSLAFIMIVPAIPHIVSGHLDLPEQGIAGLMHAGLAAAHGTASSFTSTGYNMLGSSVVGSDDQHLLSIYGGWHLFEGHPLFGAGLGAFMHAWLSAHGTPLVIHSTPLWLLAEFGVVGTLVLLAPFARAFLQELRRGERDRAGTVLLLMLLAFGIISTVHEMFYQRILWFLLGASLALVRRSTPATDLPSEPTVKVPAVEVLMD